LDSILETTYLRIPHVPSIFSQIEGGPRNALPIKFNWY
jgi:hypothetical protein